MPSLSQAIAANAARISAGGQTGTGVGPGAAAPLAPGAPPLDLAPGLPQRGVFPAELVLSSDRSANSRQFRMSERSSAFPYSNVPSSVTTQVTSAAAAAATSTTTITGLTAGPGIVITPTSGGKGGLTISGVIGSLSMPSIFTVSGALPITNVNNSPIIVSLNDEEAYTALMGPYPVSDIAQLDASASAFYDGGADSTSVTCGSLTPSTGNTDYGLFITTALTTAEEYSPVPAPSGWSSLYVNGSGQLSIADLANITSATDPASTFTGAPVFGWAAVYMLWNSTGDTISLVQSRASSTFPSGANTLAFSSSTTAGNTILLVLQGTYSTDTFPSTISDSAGNYYHLVQEVICNLLSEGTGFNGLAVYMAVNIAGGADTLSWTVPGSIDSGLAWIGEFSGLTPSTAVPTFRDIMPWDLQFAVFGSSGSTASPGSVPAPPTASGSTLFLNETSTWETAVTSIGVSVSVPSYMTESVSGSPVTTSGTITITLGFATETANYIFAGPTSGSAAAPTFRAMVTADLPTSGTWAFTGTMSGSYTMSGTETVTGTLTSSGGTLSGSWAGNPTFTGNVTLDAKLIDGTGSAGTSGYVLSSTGTEVKWIAAASGGGGGEIYKTANYNAASGDSGNLVTFNTSTFTQTQLPQGVGSGTSSITLTTTPNVGDLLIVTVFQTGSSTVAVSGGGVISWTNVTGSPFSTDTGGWYMTIAYGVVGASPSKSISFTGGSGPYYGMTVYDYSAPAGTPLVTSSTADSASSANNYVTMTPTAAGQLAIALVFLNAGDESYTVTPTGYTQYGLNSATPNGSTANNWQVFGLTSSASSTNFGVTTSGFGFGAIGAIFAPASGSLTYTLLATPSSSTWAVFVENVGSGTLTINPNGAKLDNSTASVVLSQNQGMYITTDGTNYWTERGNPNSLLSLANTWSATQTFTTITPTTINGAALSGTFTGTPTFSGNLEFSGKPYFAGTTTFIGSGSSTISGAGSATTLLVRTGTNSNLNFNTSASTFYLQALNDAFGAYIGLSIDSSTLAINPNTGGGVSINGTAAVSSFGPSAITSITVKQGIVTAISDSSDGRLKADIRSFERGLDAVCNIHPALYKWNQAGQAITDYPADQEFAGFIAQDIQQAIPEAVGTERRANGDEWLTVTDRPIIAALVNSIKELNARIQVLEARK